MVSKPLSRNWPARRSTRRYWSSRGASCSCSSPPLGGEEHEGGGSMKFYNSVGPNPRMVRMFMAEKGFEVPKVDVDLRGGENRREPYLEVNPSGQTPALELDDGTVLAEITAICEYLDEKKKDTPSLIGDSPEERAKTRMWTRRIDLNVAEPALNGFRFAEGLKMFQSRV